MTLRHVGLFIAPNTLPRPNGDWRPENELSSLDRDYPNLLAALNWSQRVGDAELELRLACALAPYWWIRAHLREGVQSLEDALRHNPQANPALRARGLNAAGMLVRQQGEFLRAAQLLEEAVSLARTIDDPRLLGETLINLATVHVEVSEDNIPTALLLVQEAITVFGDCGDTWGGAIGQIHLGFIELFAGRGSEAESLLVGALATVDELGDMRTFAIGSLLLGHAAALQGDPEHARSLVAASLRLCRETGERQTIASIVDVTAWLEREEQPPLAAVLISASDAMRAIGFNRNAYDRHLHGQVVEVLTSHLTKEELTSAREEGASWTLDQTVDRLLAFLEGNDRVSAGLQVQAQHHLELTEREVEILRLMSEGMSNNEIAATIFVSAGTVKLDIRSIYQKLGSHNRAQAIALALERGVL